MTHPDRELDADRPLRSLLRELGRHRWRLTGAVIAFAIKDVPVWLIPLIAAAIIDLVVTGGPISSVAWLGLIAAVVLLQNYPTATLFVHLYMSAVRSMAAGLRNRVTDRLQLLSIGFHSQSGASLVQSKIVRDVENIELMFSQGGNPALSVVSVFIGATVLTALNVPQFLPVFALSVPTGVGIWWTVRRRSFERNEAFRREMERLTTRVGEMATLIPITRAHGLERVAHDRVAEVTDGVRALGLRLDVLNGAFGAMSWVTMQLLAVGCLCLAAWTAISGWVNISPGQVVLLSTYFTALTSAVTNALNLYPLLARGMESARSLAEVLREPDIEHNEGKRRVDHIAGRIELEHVSVSYAPQDPPALNGVDLQIAEGETVAFVGASGSGKSTLMDTVLGFVRPTTGRILIDGTDMEQLDLRTVRRFISVVPQESVLFEGTIRENVTYGMPPLSDDVVTDALRQANALEIIEALPAGWNTLVGERGARLSGGQRQRLSIARALIRNPRILLLDEATSALDSESESKIQSALDALVVDRTTLIVAHRLATVRRADRIIYLDRGRIAEIGTHDQLVASKGKYAHLWRLQAGNPDPESA